MKRNTVNFLVDLVLFGVMYALMLTGLLIYFVLPSGSRGGGGHLWLWGWNRHDLGNIHFYLAIALMGLMFLHVILHWSWFCSTLARLLGFSLPSSPKSSVCGAVFLVVFAGVSAAALFWADGAVKESRGPGGYGGPPRAESEAESGQEYSGAGIDISGRTTLAQAAQAAGITPVQLKEELNLPDGVEPDERLGPLQREFGVEIQDVRGIVYQYRQNPPQE